MRLFNLTSSEFGVSNLTLRRIKISRISDLNDPFELLPINVRDKTLRAAIRLTRDQLAESRGVICFSKTWSNPVLWSHYADKHRGLALEFEVSDNFVMPVTYKKTLSNLKISQLETADGGDENFGRMLLATKFEDWRYENECRVLVDLTKHQSESGLYFCYFDAHLELRSVILGARCELPISEVRDLVSNYSSKVTVKKARIAFTKFAVTEDKLYRGTS